VYCSTRFGFPTYGAKYGCNTGYRLCSALSLKVKGKIWSVKSDCSKSSFNETTVPSGPIRFWRRLGNMTIWGGVKLYGLDSSNWSGKKPPHKWAEHRLGFRTSTLQRGTFTYWILWSYSGKLSMKKLRNLSAYPWPFKGPDVTNSGSSSQANQINCSLALP